MTSYTISFEQTGPTTMKLPSQLLVDGGEYVIEEDSNRGVQVRGNKNGLLYLAEVLVRAALGNFAEEFHVHLPLQSRDSGPNIEDKPELTIFAAWNSPT